MLIEEDESARPSLAWRGLHIDIVRHFFTVDEIMPFLDVMNVLGLNILHIHLSDDQGWRMEIPAYPELVELSSGSAVGNARGGYWTRADWERLRTSAAAAGIRLVPEFDMPSHVNAALHAVPGLNVGERPPVYTGTDVGFSSLRLAAPETSRFIREVITYAVELGDGWVHIGGDEAHSTPRQEYEALVRQAVEAVHSAGAHAVAWQEAAAMLGAGDLLQVWDQNLAAQPVVEAARRGVRVIASPARHAYLDMAYEPGFPYGLSWAGHIGLRDALEWSAFDVVPGLRPSAVAGVEACVWTENIHDARQLSLMLLPRLAAVAEVARTGSGHGRWESFSEEVAAMAHLWEERGLAYHPARGVDWLSH